MTLLGGANARGETGAVKWRLGILFGLGLMALAVVLASCATGPNPCIGSAKDRELMPCTCPATLNPGCAPWPTDTKAPTTPDGGPTR